MHPLIAKTFGGLSASYYARHFIFGLTIPMFILIMLSGSDEGLPVDLRMWLMFAVNTVLYPYSRFVYERVADFILGQNVFIVNAMLAIAVKVTTMLLCWFLAIFIAPIGLAYLYFHHSRTPE